jgi:hypothetical protein
VGRLACARSAPHNQWSQPQLFVEVLFVEVRSRLCLSFSAYRSFCQQRKEELAIVCSFSGERAATRVARTALSACHDPDMAGAFSGISIYTVGL